MSWCTGDSAEGGGECDAVLRDVWLFLDDELDPERRAAVQRHLDDCSPCLEEAGLDAKLKQLLARKCGGDHAPAHLRQRVVASLTQVSRSVTADGQATVAATSMTVQWSSGPGRGPTRSEGAETRSEGAGPAGDEAPADRPAGDGVPGTAPCGDAARPSGDAAR